MYDSVLFLSFCRYCLGDRFICMSSLVSHRLGKNADFQICQLSTRMLLFLQAGLKKLSGVMAQNDIIYLHSQLVVFVKYYLKKKENEKDLPL